MGKKIIVEGKKIDLTEALRHGVNGKEICVRCYRITPEEVSKDINLRLHFVERVGQLCEACDQAVY